MSLPGTLSVGSTATGSSSVILPNVVLCGIMGCGKSAVGQNLARFLGFGFVDLDRWIEAKARMSLAEIFAKEGEERFRVLESEALQYFRGVKSHVIAVGGGAVMDDGNWRLIQEFAVTVWIRTPIEVLVNRLLERPEELARRPLLRDLASVTDVEKQRKMLADRLQALLMQRGERYREARFVLDDGHQTPEQAARLIKGNLIHEGAVRPPKELSLLHRWRGNP